MSNFPLPTGPAGTPNPLTLTFQGIAGGTPVPVSQNGGPWSVSWSGQVVTLGTGSATIGNVGINGTVPVSGTFWQATQPVSGTVTANAGTGTMAVSAASLPLPTGAATAALQPALNADGGALTHVTNLPATQIVQNVAFALSNSASGNTGATPNTAVVIVPSSGTRKWVAVFNRTSGVEQIDLGSSNVAVKGGIPLDPGAGFLFAGPGAAGPIYGISPSASSPWSYVEG